MNYRLSSYLCSIGLCLLVIVSCTPERTPAPPSEAPIITKNEEPTCPATSLPWDMSWVPSDSQNVIEHINTILEGSGLAGEGAAILSSSKKYGVNPAFALAMFSKEASFAKSNTSAYLNNNPGNIIATGECIGLADGTPCKGYYGETSTDGRFGKYSNMADGIKAYFMLLASEYKPDTKRGCEDIACIISVYAPSSENDTATYIEQVTGWTQQYECQMVGLTGPAILGAQAPAPVIDVTVVVVTVPPTDIPIFENPTLSLNQRSNCREGPSTAYEVVYSFEAGTQFEIIGKYGSGWWLVPIDLDFTRKKSCWIYEEGNTISGDVNNVPQVQPSPLPPTEEPPPSADLPIYDFYSNAVIGYMTCSEASGYEYWDSELLSDQVTIVYYSTIELFGSAYAGYYEQDGKSICGW